MLGSMKNYFFIFTRFYFTFWHPQKKKKKTQKSKMPFTCIIENVKK